MRALAEAVERLNPKRVLIIKPSSLGDVIHASPILPALRALLPDAHVSWVVNSSLRSLLENRPDLDEVIAYDKGASGITARGLLGVSKLCAGLAKRRFDLTIDLQGLLRSGLMTAAARSPVRVGLEDAREGARFFYTHRVSASRTSVHAVDRVMLVAEALGAPSSRPEFHLPIGEQDDQWARRALEGLSGSGPRLIFNMGARWESKRWPVEHFAEIARRAVSEFGAGVVAVGAREDRPLAEALQRDLGAIPVLDLSGRTNLLQLAALARRADLFLSNDTGPIHLAAAVGAPVVGVYTSTDPSLTGPYGSNAVAVQNSAPRSARHYKKRDRSDRRSEITPDRVWYIVKPRLCRAMGSAA